ncbi:MAG: DUF4433 domain-containing protein [Chitinophagales bacterium]
MNPIYQFETNIISPQQGAIFRITHIDNLPFILEQGLHCRYCQPQDPNFAPIGSGDIISKRDKFRIPIAPNGVLSDYVPFYFAPRSPMLYNVYSKSDSPPLQREIVYLVSKAQIIADSSLQYVFTDGHAIMNFTQYYNDVKDLERIDWDTMRLKYWNDTPEDNDRKRKRMAEFLVYNHLPIECVKMIVVLDENMKNHVDNLVQKAKRNIIAQVRKKWFFP